MSSGYSVPHRARGPHPARPGGRLVCGLLSLALSLVSSPVRADCASPSSLEAYRAQLQRAKITAYYDLNLEKAVTDFQAAEAMLRCVAELVPTSDLVGLYLWLGSTYLDLERHAEARAAIDRAAAVSSLMRFSEPALSRQVRLLFLEARDRQSTRAVAALRFGGETAVPFFGLDGQPVGAGQVLEGVAHGDHFLQWGERGAWDGRWIKVPEGGDWSVRLEAGVPRLVASDGKAPVPAGEAVVTEAKDGERAASSGGRARRARGWAIGLGAAAAASGAVFFYEEYLYQSGALIDEDGHAVPDYRRHYAVHLVGGVAAAAFLAGSAGATILSFLPERKGADSRRVLVGRGAPRVRLVLAVPRVGLSAQW